MKAKLKKRGIDSQGSGAYGAPRGTRKHNGQDFSVFPGNTILAANAGTVTKIGYPYNPADKVKGHLRYIQITDRNGFDVRYFYVNPFLKLGDRVGKGGEIGISQDLTSIYPGITPHVHFEVKKDGAYINPNDYLRDVKHEEN